jgi:nucleoside-diphosphate-sugar epimerase
MPHTLVTGANSFVASYIIGELINQGHTVTGVVRRSAAGNRLLAEHSEWKGRLDIVIVEDYAKTGAFDAIFQAKQYEHVIHTAAPMPSVNNTDFDKHFLRPGIDGSLALLNGANKYAPKVKSIVITGSINSCTGTIHSMMADSQKEYTNDSWNDITPDFARASGSQYIMYCCSKKETERAVWSWVTTKTPKFNVNHHLSLYICQHWGEELKAKKTVFFFCLQVTVLLPALVLGPPPSLEQLNLSVSLVYRFFNGSFNELPDTYAAGLFPSYIDVRDLASAHVRALTCTAAANKRLLIGGAELTSTLIFTTLANLVDKGELQELKGWLLKDTGNDIQTSLSLPQFSADEGNMALGLSVRSAEETLGDLARKVIALKKG